jgi:hypothetical protein
VSRKFLHYIVGPDSLIGPDPLPSPMPFVLYGRMADARRAYQTNILPEYSDDMLIYWMVILYPDMKVGSCGIADGRYPEDIVQLIKKVNSDLPDLAGNSSDSYIATPRVRAVLDPIFTATR